MRKFATDYIQLEAPKIVSETKRFLKIAATITKAGVYKYDDGMALKPAKELMNATRTARYAKLTLDDHPETKVIMSQRQLFGGVEKPFFDNPKMRAILSFDKQFCTAESLNKIRSGNLRDVSIGFYYHADWTPGWAPDVNTGKIVHYDYVMRDIMIDHVVAGVKPGSRGRCQWPSCGIGVDTMLQAISVKEDKVVKRGDEWCVVHCHPDGSIGKTIKCFPTKGEADAMHGAIMASKSKSALLKIAMAIIRGDAEKPPKAWMETCMTKAKSFADEPGAFCNWLWNEGPEKLKRSMGGSTVQSHGGKIGLSEETPYEKCIRTKMEDGQTREEAEESCKEYKTDQDEAYQACLTEKKAQGMTEEEAKKACEALKPTAAGAQEQTPWQKCIAKYMSEEGGGLTMEEAAEKCKADGVAEDQAPGPETVEKPAPTQETLPTPLEACVATRMESHGEDEATARAWCEDELAGLHEPAEKIVDNIRMLKAKDEKLSRRK